MRQGYDSYDYLATAQKIRWFEPLPPIRATRVSYHPPLAFLLARPFMRMAGDVPGTQLLSFVSIIGGMLLLRTIVRSLGFLSSASGIVFLYLTASLPTFVAMSMDTGNDSLAFFWGMAVTRLSTVLLWQEQKSRVRQFVLYVALGLVLAAGALTKFSCIVFLSIPILALLVRWSAQPRPWNTLRSLLLTLILAIAVVSPYYITRNVAQEHTLFPSNMTWLRVTDLVQGRLERDAHRFAFIGNMLRVPVGEGVTTQISDSLLLAIWSQTWSSSTFYGSFFILPVLAGTICFFVCRKRSPPSHWRDMGWLLLGIGFVSLCSLLQYAYQYPLFNWGPLKLKYVPMAALWIPFAVVNVGHTTKQWLPKVVLNWSAPVVFALLALFMTANFKW